MINLRSFYRERECSKQLDNEGPPPTAAQLAMASEIDAVLGHKYTVVCLPAPTNRRRSSWPLTSETSFGLDKYKALSPRDMPAASHASRPNCYKLTGHELTVTGFASFHSFDVFINPDNTVNVVGEYPHCGPLGGLSKLIAFCEVGPHTEVRLVLIQETLDDAIAGGIISYVSTENKERWVKDGGHNHMIPAANDQEAAAKEETNEIATVKTDKGEPWTKDGEHSHIILAQ
jgi:hypothetical protein